MSKPTDPQVPGAALGKDSTQDVSAEDSQDSFDWDAAVAEFDELADRVEAGQGAYQPTPAERSRMYELVCGMAQEAVTAGMNTYPMHWDSRDRLCIALDRLRGIAAKEQTGDTALSHLYMMCCYGLERYGEVQEMADRLESFQDMSAYFVARVVLSQARRQLDFPRFSYDYTDRVRMAWDTFASGTTKLLAEFQQDGNAVQANNALDKLCQTFRYNLGLQAVASLEALLQPSHTLAGAVPVHFSSPEFDLDIIPITYFILQMPQALNGIWEPWAGLPPMLPGDARDLPVDVESALGGESVRIAVSDSPDHTGADIQIYSEPIHTMYRIHQQSGQYLAGSRVVLVLGDVAAHTYIRSITVCDESQLPKNSSATLLDLPQLLKDLGYPTKADLSDYLTKLHRTYTRTPSACAAAPGPQKLRDDITSGWSYCMRLQEEYEQGIDDACIHYMDEGIAAAFVAWPRSIAGGAETEFMQRLQKYLEGPKGVKEYWPVGEAWGTKYCYLDLLIFNPTSVLLALDSFFRSTPNGNQARIQLFRRASPAFPVDYSKITWRFEPPKTGFAPSTRPGSRAGSSPKRGKKGKRKRGKK